MVVIFQNMDRLAPNRTHFGTFKEYFSVQFDSLRMRKLTLKVPKCVIFIAILAQFCSKSDPRATTAAAASGIATFDFLPKSSQTDKTFAEKTRFIAFPCTIYQFNVCWRVARFLTGHRSGAKNSSNQRRSVCRDVTVGTDFGQISLKCDKSGT